MNEKILRAFHYVKWDQPHIEYANQVWCLCIKKDIKLIESVQKIATRLIPTLTDKFYEDRLMELKFPTLRYRDRDVEQI